MAVRTVVRSLSWACSSVGRAPHLHCGGRRFKPGQVHFFVSKSSSPKIHLLDRGGPLTDTTLAGPEHGARTERLPRRLGVWRDRKSTRLNSSHVAISYAVLCLKK